MLVQIEIKGKNGHRIRVGPQKVPAGGSLAVNNDDKTELVKVFFSPDNSLVFVRVVAERVAADQDL